MMECPNVAILLATYNGEKYIGAQLDSLLNQNIPGRGYDQARDLDSSKKETANSELENTNTEGDSLELSDYRIYIHDDGSNDNTTSIIHSYKERYPNRIEIINGPPTGGAKNNFFYMMREVSHKYESIEGRTRGDMPRYFFFCDQDDIWLKDKIQTELSVLKKLEKNDKETRLLPSLVWCDMKVVDEDLNIISPSFSSYSHLEPEELDLDRCIMHGKAAGCSMACNAQLIKMCCEIIDTRNIIMHDWALFLIARMVGRINYISVPLVLYRQHSDNGIGAQKEGAVHIFISIIERILSMKQLKVTQSNLKRYIAQIASLIQVREIYQTHKKLIDGAVAFEKMNRLDKVRFVNRFKLYRHKHGKVWTSIATFLMT